MRPKRTVRTNKHAAFWPCGSCRGNCKDDSILCEACKQWHHASCENLSTEELAFFAESQIAYSCNACFEVEVGPDYDFTRGLFRMFRVVKEGPIAIKFAAKREAQYLPDFNYVNSPIISPEFAEIDQDTISLMKKLDMERFGIPILVTGNIMSMVNGGYVNV